MITTVFSTRWLLILGIITMSAMSLRAQEDLLPPDEPLPATSDMSESATSSEDDEDEASSPPVTSREDEDEEDTHPKSQGSSPASRRAPGSPSSRVKPPVDVDAQTEPVFDRVRKLSQQRREIMSELQAEERETTHRSSARAKHPRAIERMREDLRARKSEHEARGERLQSRLDQLKQVLDKQSACRPADDEALDMEPIAVEEPLEIKPPVRNDAVATQPAHRDTKHDHDPTTTTSPTATLHDPIPEHSPHDDPNHREETSDQHATNPWNSAKQERRTAQDELDSAETSLLHPRPTPKSLKRVPPELIEAIAVTDHPIDRLGLANNLYGMGEWGLALEIYQKIPTEKLSESDKLWVEFQMANCHRQLGNIAEAERGFRVVTSRKRNSWITKSSLWWLEADARARRYEQRANSLTQQLELLKGPTNDATSKK